MSGKFAKKVMAAKYAVGTAVRSATSSPRYLTKSLMKTALKCPRRLAFAADPQRYPREKPGPFLRHLAQEGERFGEYCKRLFPHGEDIGNPGPRSASTAQVKQRVGFSHEAFEPPSLLEGLIAQTRRALRAGKRDLNNDRTRITLFEGAVQYGPFCVRPDIIDKIISPGEDDPIELRVIEVKAKSWDSRHAINSKMWTGKKKSIKAAFLPYILDVAFQSLVCRAAYPDARVSSWLMMPDKAKKWKCHSQEPRVDEDMRIVGGGIAALLNVDELVERALTAETVYPGSRKGEALKDVVQRWAEQINDKNLGFDTFSPPIGIHCASCEYRARNIAAVSGLEMCWQRATGIDVQELQQRPLVLDLYGKTKKSLTRFLSEGKYSLLDLSVSDLMLKDDTKAIKDDSEGAITKQHRQWYQVQSHRRGLTLRPQYILRRNLQREMERWRYPLHFLDFETIAPAIPYYCNASPYETFAFQFSHHTVSRRHDGTLEVHHESEFLHTEQGDPNVPFLKALAEAVGAPMAKDGGTVFRWSAHENTVLRTMLSSPETTAAMSPHEVATLSALLITGAHPMVDLCKLASNYYYVDGSEGSSSIKQLLRPTLQASDWLKDVYGSPTYNGTNFRNFQWFQLDDETGEARCPYEILSEENSASGRANVTKGGDAVGRNSAVF